MRHIESLIALSRRALAAALAPGSSASFPADAPVFAVDCTAGNGHDTLFLAECCRNNGHVWAFDVQEAALASTKKRLAAAGLEDRVTLIAQGHEHVGDALPPHIAGHLRAAVFNLGFLPGSDKEIVTRAETTLRALKSLTTLLAPEGLICLHSYTGHPGGQDEYAAISSWFSGLPWEAWRVASYCLSNKNSNAETLFLAERQKCRRA